MSELHEQNNKSIVRRFYNEAVSQGQTELLSTLVGQDFFDNSPMQGQQPGLEGLRQRLSSVRSAFPDMQVEAEEIICDGDRVVARWHMRGSQTGEYFGLKPAGQHVDVTGFDIFRMSEGKIKERWQQFDTLSLARTLKVPYDSELKLLL